MADLNKIIEEIDKNLFNKIDPKTIIIECEGMYVAAGLVDMRCIKNARRTIIKRLKMND